MMERRTFGSLENIVAGQSVEQAERAAAGLANGGCASGQAEGAKVRGAREWGAVGDEKFAAPDRAVGAETGAVPREAKDGRREFVFRHAGGNVGEVMLHANGIAAFGELARKIAGMRVARHGLGRDIVERGQIPADPAEGFVRGGRFQIADVLADEDIVPEAERNGVFQMRAHGQHRIERLGDVNGQGRVTARAAHDLLATEEDANDGIIDVADDGPVVHEEGVGDAVQTLDRFGIVDANRLVGEISAGGDDGKTEFAHEQVMERRGGQHDAEVRIARRDRGRDPAAAQQDDGRFRRGEEPRFEIGNFAELPRAFRDSAS